MQNIQRAILPNIIISQGTIKDICYLIFKVLDCAHWYKQFLAFVGESICQGETALFVSRLTLFLRS